MREEEPHDAAQWQVKPAAYERSLDEIDRHEGSYLLVAEYDSRLGAAAHLVTFPIMHGGTGRQAEVVGVWVADAFRFSGLDAMLLDHALARADDLGCEHVHVLANGARSARHSFWERAGFIHLAAGYVRSVVERPRLRRIS
jgi:N-acetylglutamate synthase-like GNAT family acetyltransferase